jgi:hypothetical protein
LIVRFFLNILIVLWVPFLIAYIASVTNVLDQWWMEFIIYFTVILLILWTIYMNSIVDAFFSTYWYKIYMKIKDDGENNN